MLKISKVWKKANNPHYLFMIFLNFIFKHSRVTKHVPCQQYLQCNKLHLQKQLDKLAHRTKFKLRMSNWFVSCRKQLSCYASDVPLHLVFFYNRQTRQTFDQIHCYRQTRQTFDQIHCYHNYLLSSPVKLWRHHKRFVLRSHWMGMLPIRWTEK